jgi:amidohydrolase
MAGRFEGTVQLIFQPGEENLPGGALRMMEEGLFSEREPDLIIGQHVDPDLESGTLGFRPGPYMASTDELYFTITGKGGHAAMPHKLTDPVLIAAQMIVALQQIVSRKGNPAVPSVLSIGKVIAAGATN